MLNMQRKVSAHAPTVLARVTLVFIGLVLLLAMAAPALAAEVQQGESVVIGPDQVINDDVYAFGTNVQVLGTVNGDLFTAGNAITVSGTVTGSVFAAGNTVSISGNVQRGLHAAGNTVMLSGPVAQDATVASGTLSVAPQADIGRDLLVASGSANLAAPIARNVKAGVGDLTLAGPIGGDVEAQATTLRLADSARVAGSLTYTSEQQAAIAPGATVGSPIQHLQPAPPATPVVTPVTAMIDWLRGLVGLGVIGLLFVFIVPRFSAKTLDVGRTEFWQSIGVGFALAVAVPIAAVLVLGIGVFVGGWMLGLALLALFAMACAIGAVFASMLAGKLVVQAFRQPPQHLAWNLVEGLALFGLVGLIPYVGGVVLLLAMVFGLGAFALSVFASYRTAHTSLMAVTPTPAPMQPTLAAA
jgi:cytoskeletal protein CcmA (bactofilin family)